MSRRGQHTGGLGSSYKNEDAGGSLINDSAFGYTLNYLSRIVDKRPSLLQRLFTAASTDAFTNMLTEA